jgi:hypothetical protein
MNCLTYSKESLFGIIAILNYIKIKSILYNYLIIKNILHPGAAPGIPPYKSGSITVYLMEISVKKYLISPFYILLGIKYSPSGCCPRDSTL